MFRDPEVLATMLLGDVPSVNGGNISSLTLGPTDAIYDPLDISLPKKSVEFSTLFGQTLSVIITVKYRRKCH